MLFDIAFVKKGVYGTPEPGTSEGARLPVLEPEELIVTIQVTAETRDSALIQAVLRTAEDLRKVPFGRVEALVRPFSMKG